MLPAIENIKNLFWISRSPAEQELEYCPRLYLEAKIDFNDVRTGFQETCNINITVEIPSGRLDPFWDLDAIRDIHPENLCQDVPLNVCFSSLPAHVDKPFISWIETKFIQYLLRNFTVKVYRNFSLDEYSFSGETRNDFIIRCLELNKAPMHREFDLLHEVFNRKLERLQQKYLGKEDSQDLEPYKTDLQNRELFNRIQERISELFLRTEFNIQHIVSSSGTAQGMNELQERLQATYFEAQEAVSRILDSYEEKTKSVDEYIIHPAMKDIHFVRSCVLWTPEGAI